ncbi:MAG: hypothetical protein AAGG50_15725 [Bacteroidota bacterium]
MPLSLRRWTLCLALHLGLAVSLSAQSPDSGIAFTFDLGYQAHFESPDGLNFVVGRYNETRNFLTSEMEPFDQFSGLTGSLGAYLAWLYFDLGFNRRAQERSAEGVLNGQATVRGVRTTNYGVYLSAGVALASNGVAAPFKMMAVTAGMRSEFSATRFSTRTGPADQVGSLDWEEVENDLRFYVGPFVKFTLGPLVVEPYYLFDVDFSDLPSVGLLSLNEEINPSTFQRDPDPTYGGGGFGLRIAAILYLGSG